MTVRSADTRDLLLTAALNLLMEEEGVLTFDRISKKSGISKGGLIHHFPTKESLVKAIVEALVVQYEKDVRQAAPEAEIGSPEEVKAYVEGSLDPAMREATASVARGIIRLYGSDFKKDAPFLTPWRQVFAKRLDGLRKAKNLETFAKAAVVVLAIESFTLIDALNLHEFSSEEIEAIKEELLNRRQ